MSRPFFKWALQFLCYNIMRRFISCQLRRFVSTVKWEVSQLPNEKVAVFQIPKFNISLSFLISHLERCFWHDHRPSTQTTCNWIGPIIDFMSLIALSPASIISHPASSTACQVFAYHIVVFKHVSVCIHPILWCYFSMPLIIDEDGVLNGIKSVSFVGHHVVFLNKEG